MRNGSQGWKKSKTYQDDEFGDFNVIVNKSNKSKFDNYSASFIWLYTFIGPNSA